MKRNKTMGIVWLIIAAALTLLLIQGLMGGLPGPRNLPSLFRGDGSDMDEDWVTDGPGSATQQNEFAGKDIHHFKAELRSLPLFVGASADGKVHVDFLDGAEKFCKIRSGGGSVSVKQKGKHNASSGKVRVSLPAAWQGDLELEGVSGSVMLDGITADSLDLEAVSGSVTITGCAIGSMDLETVSGSVSADGSFRKVSSETVSGSVRVDFKEAPGGRCKFESVSGSVTLGLPHDSGYTLDYSSMSGSFSDEITGVSGSKKGSSKNGDGGIPISVSTVSGSVRVR